MAFPISVAGEIPLPAVPEPDFPKRVIDACLDQLEHEGAQITERAGYGVCFRRPIFSMRFYAFWWLSSIARTGTIEVSPPTTGQGAFALTYHLSRWRAVVYATIVACVFLLAPDGWMALALWTVWVGVPHLFVALRARSWMEKRIEEARSIQRTAC